MKRAPIYFNKGVIFLLSLAMQIEASAQRGRAIPQDWGAGGDSHSDGGVLSDLWFIILLAAFFGVLYIISKTQSVFKGKEEPKTNHDKSIQHQTKHERIISKEQLKSEEKANTIAEDAIKALPESFFNTVSFKCPKEWKILTDGLIERLKSRVIWLPLYLEKVDDTKLNKFEVVIIPHSEETYFKRLLSHYNGIIVADNVQMVWVGSMMTYSAFNALYNGYKLYKTEDNHNYIVNKSGFHTYFTEQLQDCFVDYSENRKPKDCKIREQYSLTRDAFYFDLYSYVK